MKRSLLDRIKINIEDLFYIFGFKIYLGREPVPELDKTTDLNTQFNNLTTIKKWLEKDHKEHAENIKAGLFPNKKNTDVSDRKFLTPELKQIVVDQKTNTTSYALIWKGSARRLTITYNKEGTLVYEEFEFTDEGERLASCGCGVNYARDVIWNLNHKS